jgi:hypothetical protein
MKENNRLNKTSTIYLAIPVLVCLAAMFLCACTSTGKKETTTINNVTDQEVAKKDNSDAGKTGDDQEIVCRSRVSTGTTFKKKTCATKAEWARRDKIKKEKIDEFNRDMNSKTGLYDDNLMGNTAGRPQ